MTLNYIKSVITMLRLIEKKEENRELYQTRVILWRSGQMECGLIEILDITNESS